MKINKKTPVTPIFTHEGGKAARTDVKNQLIRSVMSCLLWEDEFYESGETIAKRISDLVKANKPEFVSQVAIVAREQMHLRHVPLLLVKEMAANPSHRPFVAETLARVIQRADELSESLSIYWRNQPNAPIANSFKKGLAKAFTKFNEYQLAKYNRDADIKLRDVLFLCHAKPLDEAQAATWKKLVDNTLQTPDTWETALSSGANKKETFMRLINEGKLGGMALIRNLRGMVEAGIDHNFIHTAIQKMNTERILPYRFIAAAKYAPQFEPALETAMFKSLEGIEKLAGTTTLLIDVSGSMDHPLSGKSDLTRIDAACGLAILLREICENVRIFTFSRETVEVPARRGFALRDAIKNSQAHRDTYMSQSLKKLNYGSGANRLIVISDEQANSQIGNPKTKAYMLNVASAKNGIGYGEWMHIDGFSESVVKFIGQYESAEDSSSL